MAVGAGETVTLWVHELRDWRSKVIASVTSYGPFVSPDGPTLNSWVFGIARSWGLAGRSVAIGVYSVSYGRWAGWGYGYPDGSALTIGISPYGGSAGLPT